MLLSLVLSPTGLLPVAGTEVQAGTISVDTVWSVAGSPYRLLGDIIVAPNIRLTIEQGVQVLVAGFFEIEVQGTLVTTGTSQSPAAFSLERATTTLGSWRGVRVPAGGSVQMDHAVISHARQGLLFDGSSAPSTISNGSVFASDFAGVSVQNAGNITFSDCFLVGNEDAMQLSSALNVTITRCTLSNNRSDGISASDSIANVTRNTFNASGIRATGSGFYLQHNNFRNGSGFFGIGSGFGYVGQEGNYWDDYSGVDDGSGGRTAGDGIGDTALPHSLFDNHPRMGPVSGAGNPRADSKPPVVYLDSPVDGVRTTVDVFVLPRFFDDSGIGLVEFLINGAVETSQTRPPFRWEWNVSGLPPGTYTVSVAAYDPFGNRGSVTHSVVVGVLPDLPPGCAIAAPIPGAGLRGLVTVAGTASDPENVLVRVEVRVDGGSWNAATGTAVWNYEWNSSSVSDGAHTLDGRAYDGAQYSPLCSVTVTTDNGVPPNENREFVRDYGWAILMILVVVTAVLIAVWWRRKRGAGSTPSPSQGAGHM